MIPRKTAAKGERDERTLQQQYLPSAVFRYLYIQLLLLLIGFSVRGTIPLSQPANLFPHRASTRTGVQRYYDRETQHNTVADTAEKRRWMPSNRISSSTPLLLKRPQFLYFSSKLVVCSLITEKRTKNERTNTTYLYCSLFYEVVV